jgi:hypothetical protein
MCPPAPNCAIRRSCSPARGHAAIEAVGDGGHQHVGALNRGDEVLGGERFVVGVQLSVEQFLEARLHRIGETACHDDFELFRRHSTSINHAAPGSKRAG